MIMNNVGEKIYIGKSKNIFTRWSRHVHDAYKNNNYDNSVIHKAIRKYGVTRFWFKILELCDEDELNEKEIFYINLYQSDIYNNNYNMTPGGGGGCSIGSANGNSKLTEYEVYEIRDRYKNIENKMDVYDAFKNKVSINTFSDVWIGKTWSHVHMDVYTEENKRMQRNNYDKGKSHQWMRVLLDDDIYKIREMKEIGRASCRERV